MVLPARRYFQFNSLQMLARLKILQPAVFLIGFAFLTTLVFAHPAKDSSAKKSKALRTFLQAYFRESGEEDDRSIQYFYAFVDLNEDGDEEAIVYVTGEHVCGSGGCSMLVLASDADSFKVITATAITRPPIRVLSTKSNGWHDLSVVVQGGGIIKPYEARLQFNGKTYPHNPTVAPAQRLKKKARGRIVVPVKALTEKTNPLYL